MLSFFSLFSIKSCRHHLHSNPSDKIERPKKNPYIADYYSLDELNTLFTKSKRDPLEIVILLASFYGLRRSEVLGLKWSAFDFV